MKGLLLAGGHGTRLRPLTFTGNKHMLPIANKPMLLYGLQHLVNVGIKEIFVVLGPIKEGVREVIGDGSDFGAKVEYIEQPEPKGLAHAVLLSEPYIGDDSFVMYLGDNLLREGAKLMVQTFMENKADCVISVKPVKNPSLYGIAEMQDGRILRLVEKPKQSKSNLAVIGVYVFNESVFEAVNNIKPSWRNELEIVDAIQYLVDHGKNVTVRSVQDWWKDTGKPEDLLEANQLILQDLSTSIEGSVDDHSGIVGDVSIGKGTRIENSRIRGPVIIGSNCDIGPNTYLGPYTAIGDNCRLVGSELENSIVMEGAVIDCGNRIVDSIIGKDSKITSADGTLPKGMKFVVGDSTYLSL
ncbi:MAG: glucose-1-phosphate thymidylyltransferase [Candidatus Nitrosomirales archaeon]|jgi:glucose-1-phosphate thymidylyltransferase